MATPPVPKPNSKDFNQERYDRLTKNLLEIIASNEGTYNSDLIPEKAKEIIKTPYDMVYGHGKYLFPNKPPTEMTIREVIDFGRPLVNKTIKSGLGSSAMGKYQVMANSYKRNKPNNKGVLEEFANKLNLDIDTQLFTPEIQDAIAIRMLEERVPSLKDFATSETDENLNKVLDELNATWRGVPDSKNETSEGQSLQGLSAEEIGDELKRIKYVEGGTFDPMGSKKTDYSETDRMLQDNKIDEQEINAGDNSLENQRERQRAITKQKSGINFSDLNPVSTAEGADLERINRTVTEEINKVDPIDADSTRDRMEVINPPTNAASDAFQTDLMMEDYDAIQPEEERDTTLKTFTEDDNMERERFFRQIEDEPEDTVVDREGMDYSTPEVTMNLDDTEVGRFIANLFNSKNLMADETEMLDDQEYQNLKEGGEVEANFVDDDKEEDETDPPPGATPEQVADDIPAMLSEGEYVLPANVVNFLGVKNIAEMHQSVLDEIQQMSDLGFVENVDANGEPEEDDDEMPTVDKSGSVETQEDKKGTATLVIASASPKGMMCPDPVMLNGGGSGGADFDPFGSSAAGGAGGGGYDSDADLGGDFFEDPVEPVEKNYTDTGFEVEGLGRSQKELDEDMAKFQSKMDNPDFYNMTNKIGKGIISALGGRYADALDGLHSAGLEIRSDRHKAAAEAYDKEFLGTDKWNLEDKKEAMFQSFAVPGFSKQEEDIFYGGAEAMQEGMDTPGGISEGRQFGDGYISDAELDAAMGSNTASKDSSPKKQFIPGVGYVRDGGLMAKGYNTGGQVTNFVPDVGIVPISTGLESDMPTTGIMDYREVLKKTRSFEPDVYGFKSWDDAQKFYKDNPKLEGSELRQRQNDARYLTNKNFTGPSGSNMYAKDAYLSNKLKSASVDSQDYSDVMDRWKKGEAELNPLISTSANAQLTNDLNAYAREKRTKRFGFTPQDASQLPEGSTNLDALKTIFRTDIEWENDALDQANFDTAGTRNPSGLKFKPNQWRNVKENLLLKGNVGNYEDNFQLDKPMNIETVNRVSAYLNTGGDVRYIDPNNEEYVDDIFNKFEGLKNLSPSSGLLSRSSPELGEYVSDVGYV